jgi:hypothetical protein
MDYVSIGSSPCNESCAQVGTDGYTEKAKKECRAFQNQLERHFKNFPDGCFLSIKSFPHDFGSYLEVIVRYDENDEAAANFAYDIENNCPENWDDEAKKELGIGEE